MCLQEYDRSLAGLPRVLPCGHTLCTLCIMKLMTPKFMTMTIIIPCPICRQEHLRGPLMPPVNPALRGNLRPPTERGRDAQIYCSVRAREWVASPPLKEEHCLPYYDLRVTRGGAGRH